MSKELIVGIDLGTTYSEIAAFVGDDIKVLGQCQMLPSCVGFSPDGDLLVGEPARNQLVIYPERTVHSIKRKIGSDDVIKLGEREFTPPEISSLILRELVRVATKELKLPVKKAVITVPAYFSDAQRSATREAGVLADLEVMRVLNEPTAASLAYGLDSKDKVTAMIYDLGGGTFDVSIVSIENDVTEVLASHGDNNLGGNDFDQLLLDLLVHEFQEKHGCDITENNASYSRLRLAAEEAKKQLSFERYVRIREESLLIKDGKPLHLDLEISREEYEDLIRPLVESTLESVSIAMKEAGRQSVDIDVIILVGGSTRTPLVSAILEQRTGITPRQEVHPDLCVALGAGVLASRLEGRSVDQVLVDTSPFSFGISHLGEINGLPYTHCYHPIIKRNTPLPITRTESYWTAAPHQTTVQLSIYQGDNPDAQKNILVGKFLIEDLTSTYDPNEVLCRMHLDIDGILNVTAIEKITDKSKQITILDVLQAKSDDEILATKERLNKLFQDDIE
ncbi:Hsp70 family protein, partial [bacterium]|nr:Hsp70 family protein [bacterium]